MVLVLVFVDGVFFVRIVVGGDGFGGFFFFRLGKFN